MVLSVPVYKHIRVISVQNFMNYKRLREVQTSLTHCIMAESSTVLCWTSQFVNLRMLGLFSHFYSILDGKSCQQTM